MVRPLVLLLAGLLLILISIASLQTTWLPRLWRETGRHARPRTRGGRSDMRLRGPWLRTIIAAGGVLIGFILCLLGAGELLVLMGQAELHLLEVEAAAITGGGGET